MLTLIFNGKHLEFYKIATHQGLMLLLYDNPFSSQGIPINHSLTNRAPLHT